MISTKNRIAQLLAQKRLETISGIKFRPEDHLFDQQLRFLKDPSPNKVAVCSRRSGKTVECAADLLETATNNSDVVCLYITLSRNNAKKIIWRELKNLNKKYKLGGKENLSELSISFPNNSIIYLSGAKDINEIEKFRGLALKKVYIDECQSFRAYIQELIDDVLAPALMDHAGTLCLIGTPSPIPSGYFYDCAEKPNTTWSKHAWTFFDNPFLVTKSNSTHHTMLDRELKRRGVDANDPSIQREFFGKWVWDSDSLLVHYDKLKNDFDKMPSSPAIKYTYILGVDIGMDDADALAVLAWEEHSPNIYLVEELVNPGQDITALAGMIEKIRTKYDISKMVIDTGGLGKKITEELVRRFQLPLVAADKVRKMENIALLNTYLRTGKFKAKSTSKFAQDSYLVEIDRDKSTPDKIKVSDRYHSDIIDAVLYAFKESPAYTFQEAKNKPAYGSKQWADEEEDRMFDQAVKHFNDQKEIDRRNMGNFD